MFLTPWNAVDKPQVKRRGRLARACDACFVRKIWCDVAKPRCNWCDHHDQACTFQRKFATSENIQGITTRDSSPLEQDPNMPNTRSWSLSPSPPSTAVGNPHSFAHNLQCAGRHLGNICNFNGMPVLCKSSHEWVKSCTGQEFRLDQFPASVQGWQLPLTNDSNDQCIPSGRPELPGITLLLKEIQHYQSTAYGIFFPIIDPSLFQSTIDAAYHQKTSKDSPGLISAKACIFAFHALALMVIPDKEMPFPRPTIDYFREAYRLLPEVFNETASLDGFQALLLLCLCSQGLAGDIYIVDYLLSATCRFVFHLHGNITPSMTWEMPSNANYHARHLFWVTYVCDKGFSLVSGLAPRLEESQCDLEICTRPSGESFAENDKMSHIYGDPLPGSYLRSYVVLASIQSRIYRELYAPAALKQSDARLLERIRDLDCSLENWRSSLPFGNRPSLVTLRTRRPPSSNPESFDMRTSVFHLQYHHCMIMIHQATSRCTWWIQNQNTHGTGSSLKISVAASRSLLGSFLFSSFELDSQNLLFTLSYFIQASIIIFCQLLSKSFGPVDEESENDIGLLGGISEQIGRHVNIEDPACYTAKIKFAGEVIGELKRLAHCAITRNGDDITN